MDTADRTETSTTGTNGGMNPNLPHSTPQTEKEAMTREQESKIEQWVVAGRPQVTQITHRVEY